MQESISRSGFFHDIFRLFNAEILHADLPSQERESNSFILPPGAISSNDYREICTKCYDCVAACPYEAISVFRSNTNSHWYGLPVIEPRRQPCYQCENFPCINACKAGALIHSENTVKIGSAVIIAAACLAYQGYFCRTCINMCPLSGKAIFCGADFKPQINSDICTGCGQCTYACPAEIPAIIIQSNMK